MEYSNRFKRRIKMFRSFIWDNFATNNPCDFDNFEQFIRGIKQEIQEIIEEGEINGESVSEWLTYNEGVSYVNDIMINDLREYYYMSCYED